ncbi:MAG: hypothetical protein ACRCZ2_00450 [Fusobacteriaceae bacterium]
MDIKSIENNKKVYLSLIDKYLDNSVFRKLYLEKIKKKIHQKKIKIKIFINRILKIKIIKFNKLQKIIEQKITITNLLVLSCSRVLRI